MRSSLQSYFVLRQTAKRFEDEATWKDLSRKDNLGAFLLSYLSSPYSSGNTVGRSRPPW
jgi:hypothetical protein